MLVCTQELRLFFFFDRLQKKLLHLVLRLLSRQRDLLEPAKYNIRSRIGSNIQSASITENNLTKDKRQALKRLKTDEDIVILPTDKDE